MLPFFLAPSMMKFLMVTSCNYVGFKSALNVLWFVLDDYLFSLLADSLYLPFLSSSGSLDTLALDFGLARLTLGLGVNFSLMVRCFY